MVWTALQYFEPFRRDSLVWQTDRHHDSKCRASPRCATENETQGGGESVVHSQRPVDLVRHSKPRSDAVVQAVADGQSTAAPERPRVGTTAGRLRDGRTRRPSGVPEAAEASGDDEVSQ